jgi:hypothetical protein
MNEQSLFERLEKSPLLNNLVDRIAMSSGEVNPLQVFLQNLNGSAAAFVLQSIFANTKTNHLNHIVNFLIFVLLHALILVMFYEVF